MTSALPGVQIGYSAQHSHTYAKIVKTRNFHLIHQNLLQLLTDVLPSVELNIIASRPALGYRGLFSRGQGGPRL